MAEVDTKLAAALRQAKGTSMFFAFVAKGSNDGTLLVEKKKIAASDISEAKSESGGKAVFKGRCHGEDGKMIFEVPKEPPSTLAKQIKAVIHRDAGLTLQVEVRTAANLAEEEADETEASETVPQAPPPPPAPPNPAAARFSARLKALAPVMQKADATGSDGAKEARARIAEANKLYVAKQYDQANAALDQAETLIKQAFATAKPSAPAAPAQDGSARFATRLKALAPAMQKAEATGNNAATQARQEIAQANKLFLAKQYDQANAGLDRAEALIKQALIAGASTQQQAPPKLENMQAEWEERVMAMEPRVLEAKKTRPDDAKWMTLFMSSQDLGEAGKYQEALKVLDKIEALLAAPSSAQPTADNGILVAMQTSRLRWDQTRKQVQVDLQALEKAIIDEVRVCNDDPREEEEYDLGELANKTKILYTVLDKFDTRLLDKLDEGLSAKTTELRQQKHDEARAIITEYQGILNGDAFLAQIDNSGFLPTSIKQTFASVLADLASKLT